MPSPEQPSNRSETNSESPRRREFIDREALNLISLLQPQSFSQTSNTEQIFSFSVAQETAAQRELEAALQAIHEKAKDFGARPNEIGPLFTLTLGSTKEQTLQDNQPSIELTTPAALETSKENTAPTRGGNSEKTSTGTPAQEHIAETIVPAAPAVNADANPLRPNARTVSSDINLQKDRARQTNKLEFKFSTTDPTESPAINISFRYRRILEALEPAQQAEFVRTLEERYAAFGQRRPMVSAALRSDLYRRIRDNYDDFMKEPTLEKILKLVRE